MLPLHRAHGVLGGQWPLVMQRRVTSARPATPPPERSILHGVGHHEGGMVPLACPAAVVLPTGYSPTSPTPPPTSRDPHEMANTCSYPYTPQKRYPLHPRNTRLLTALEWATNQQLSRARWLLAALASTRSTLDPTILQQFYATPNATTRHRPDDKRCSGSRQRALNFCAFDLVI